MKPAIVGMNNNGTHGVFFPLNKACSGGRILSMMNLVRPVSAEEFLKGFFRVNMHHGDPWDFKLAKKNAPQVIEVLQGRRVIVFGRQTASALGLPRSDDFWTDADGYFTYTTLPHPSGLTRDYNDEAFRLKAGKLLVDELFSK